MSERPVTPSMQVLRTTRAIVYSVAGIMPAFGLCLLACIFMAIELASLFFPEAKSLRSPLITIIMIFPGIAGFPGLILATIFPPSSSSRQRVIQTISLLVCYCIPGIPLAIAFLCDIFILIFKTGYSGEFSEIEMFLGIPIFNCTLMAVVYFVETIFAVRFKRMRKISHKHG